MDNRMGMAVGRLTMSLGALLLGLSLSACTMSSMGNQTRVASAPENLPPVQSSSVQSGQLPPLNGQPGQVGPNGERIGPDGLPMTAPGAQPGEVGAPASDGSFADLGSDGLTPGATGRDLSGGLSIEKLLGGWTLITGDAECRLNLTYTKKTGTDRYRASTPGCTMPGLAVVSSWQLAGAQVQLFDENGDLIGALLQSGNRFIGTLAGGQPVSMAG